MPIWEKKRCCKNKKYFTVIVLLYQDLKNGRNKNPGGMRKDNLALRHMYGDVIVYWLTYALFFNSCM